MALEPGDRVVFYTDGISEAMNAEGEQFGEHRLCEVVQALPPGLTARAIAEGVLAALDEFLGSVEPQDDMTLLVIRMLEPVPVDGPAAGLPEVAAVH